MQMTITTLKDNNDSTINSTYMFYGWNDRYQMVEMIVIKWYIAADDGRTWGIQITFTLEFLPKE